MLDRRGGGKRRFLELRRKVQAAAARRRLGALPRPVGPLRGERGRAARRHRARPRRPQHRPLPGIAALDAAVVRRATTVIAVSDYLRRELELKLPEARGKTEVVDSGVDLERFAPAPRDETDAERPAFVAVGSLTERKNVVRLADAFARLGRGSLTFVGDGPLRGELEGRERVRVVGRVPHDEVPRHLAAADVVCAPSLLEPFGQSILEAMACGRTVVATRLGGPPEFVPPEAGILVDPLDVGELARALEAAAAFPSPNDAARAAAAAHDVRLQAERVERILERAARGRPGASPRTA